jgi:hypothetical protein
MKKYLLILSSLLCLPSCTSIFWSSNSKVPAQKLVANGAIHCEVFDAVGERSTVNAVQIVTSQKGDSALITQFLVPKFSTIASRRNRTNYLWVVDGRDTSVYELTYRGRNSMAIFATAGTATLLSLIPRGMNGISPNATLYTLFVGGNTLVWGGLLIDAPTAVAGVIKESRANANSLQPRWKLKNVRRLAPEEYPLSLIRSVGDLKEM